MLNLRKYIALAIVFLPLILFNFIGHKFIIEEGNEIYGHVPVEADLVIEVNTRNFIKEIAYERIFNEEYFIRKVYPDNDLTRAPISKTGINYFDRIVVFRENWPNEKVWALVMSYNNRAELTKYASEKFPNSHLYFGEDNFVIIQVSVSENQEKLDTHFSRLAALESKPINEKFDVRASFPRDKEINCYVSPQTRSAKNQIIDGIIMLDFNGSHIDLDGYFTPISDFHKNETIKYPINQEKGLSIRSSLNLFRSVFWFSNEKLDNLPEYEQMAFDYDGMEMLLSDQKVSGYLFKTFPNIQLRMEIADKTKWEVYFDSLVTNNSFTFDTLKKQITTPQGTFLNYNINGDIFELKQEKIVLNEQPNDSVYFEVFFNSQELFKNTVIGIDKESPPSKLKQNLGMIAGNEIIEQLRELTVISTMNFRLVNRDGNNIIATGKIEMEETKGNAMIECLFIGRSALSMLQEYL